MKSKKRQIRELEQDLKWAYADIEGLENDLKMHKSRAEYEESRRLELETNMALLFRDIDTLVAELKFKSAIA